MSILKVENIYKSFGKVDVLKGVSFLLEQGQVLSIIGSSGSGKTTLLRCLNFLERPDKGIIQVNDEMLFDAVGAIHESPVTIKSNAIIIVFFGRFTDKSRLTVK